MNSVDCPFCGDTGIEEVSATCPECNGQPHSTDGRRVCSRWLGAARAGRFVIVGQCIDTKAPPIRRACVWCAERAAVAAWKAGAR